MANPYRLKDGSRVPLRYIRYLCPVCDKPHLDHCSAAECCEPDIRTVNYCPVCKKVHHTPEEAITCHSDLGYGDVDATICPVCHKSHEWIDSAVSCCLWKSLDIGQRHRLGMRLANSAAKPHWSPAICDEFGIDMPIAALAFDE